MNFKFNKFLLTTTALLALSVGSAQADDSKNIDKLEKQLEKALQLIEQQSQQVESLSQKLKKIESTNASTAPVRRRSSAAINTELEERLTVLEDQLFEIDDKVGSQTLVNAFDAVNFDIGGFFNSAYTFVDSENGSAAGFNRQIFELLIRADLDENWSAFFAGGFLREANVVFDDTGNEPDFAFPSIAGGTVNPQIIGWFNYKHNDAFNIRVGRLITPHGIINIEHFPATLLDTEQPQFLRPFPEQTIFPNFTTGVQFHGKFFFGSDNLEYYAYAASPQSSIEEPIYGGRLAYTFGDYGVTVGVNGAIGSRAEDSTTEYTLFGADLLVDKGPVLWKTEVFMTDEDDEPGRFAFYTQPAYRINDQWIAFYRYDFLDDGSNTTAVIPNAAGDTTEHVLGVNYLPLPNVRTRLIYTHREFGESGSFAETDADIFQISATYSF